MENQTNNKKVFLKFGKIYKQSDGSFTVVEKLENKIYNLCIDENGILFLEEYIDKFNFDFKLYDIDTEFINHVVRAYKDTNRTLGVLLNGIKGTGKSVTAKQIANLIDAPKILINNAYPGIAKFISSMSQNVVFIFDEFEKSFTSIGSHLSGGGPTPRKYNDDCEEDKSTSLLDVMDGVHSTNSRHMFIMTTNELRINDNFKNRPGRFRYLRTYGNLKPNIVMNYLNENLTNKKRATEVFNLIKELEIITIDIVRAICDEINLYDVSIETLCSYMNIKRADRVYNIVASRPSGLNASKDVGTIKSEFKSKIKKYMEADAKHDYGVMEDCNMYTDFVYTSYRVTDLDCGDVFYNENVVVEPLDNDNIIVLRTPESMVYCAKVLNPEQNVNRYQGFKQIGF